MDVNKLTLGEIETVETMARAPITALNDENRPKAPLLIALAVVINRRTDPSYKREDAERLSMSELTSLIEAGGDDADPT